MREYLKDYIKSIDNIIDSKKVSNTIIDDHLIKISFFQHERFIHLIVTLTYALLFILSLALISVYLLFGIVSFIFLCFLIPYIYHYFYLENGVQYLYKQYDKLKELVKN